jgi:hypothetical protein
MSLNIRRKFQKALAEWLIPGTPLRCVEPSHDVMPRHSRTLQDNDARFQPLRGKILSGGCYVLCRDMRRRVDHAIGRAVGTQPGTAASAALEINHLSLDVGRGQTGQGGIFGAPLSAR